MESYVIIKNGKAYNVPLSKIVYVESMGNYIHVHLKNKSAPVVLRQTFRSVMDALSNGVMVQINRGCVINIHNADKLIGTNVRMHNGELLPISRGAYQGVKAEFFKKSLF